MPYTYIIPDAQGKLTQTEWVDNQAAVFAALAALTTIVDGGAIYKRFKQEFVTSAVTKVTITVNAAVIPTDLTEAIARMGLYP